MASATAACSSSITSSNRIKALQISAMSPQKKVNKYDPGWKKQWFGAGLFLESSEDVSVDVVRKLEARKVLSGVERSGLLSKAEGLGLTLSSVERLGLLSLLSLLDSAAALSPSALASLSLPLLLAALVAAQAALVAALGAGGAGPFVASVVLAGLQESD